MGFATQDAANYAKAYSSFKGKLGETSALMVSIAERKQSVDMISKRALQLVRFVRKLKKLDILSAATELGVAPPKVFRPRYVRRLSIDSSLRRRYIREKEVWRRGKGIQLKKSAKVFANNFLEFHFGWSPLINDIGNAVKVLQDRLPTFRVKGHSILRTENKLVDYITSYAIERTTDVSSQEITIRARASMENPNLDLANRLGFTDPLGVLWEVVPFSFVVDWFVNVGDFLSSFSDFAGITLSDKQVTTFTKGTRIIVYEATYSPQDVVYKQSVYSTITCTRSVGSIPGPALTFKSPWTLSASRGLTAISLLIQSLR